MPYVIKFLQNLLIFIHCRGSTDVSSDIIFLMFCDDEIAFDLSDTNVSNMNNNVKHTS